MDFALHDDHLALREAVRRFCDGEYATPQRGDREKPDQRLQRWQAMSHLGLLGLPFSGEHGGSEQGPVEVMVVAQELGRALAGGAWLSSTVMAGQLLNSLATPDQKARWLPALAEGRLQASVALYEDKIRYQWHDIALSAFQEGDAYTLNGQKTLVLEGDSAELFLLVARTAGVPGDRHGLSVMAIDAHAPGLKVVGFDTLDGRRAAHLHLHQVSVSADRIIGPVHLAADALDAMVDGINAALCAEAAGIVEALMSHTAEHLRTRKQFGAPLAKFQVLQHRVADMAIALEQIKSMACAAAAAVADQDTLQRQRVVRAAKAYVSQQGRQIGMTAIQLHGGMGMTDECRVGHYAKRLMVIGQMFGDSAWQLEQLAASSHN